MKKTEWNVVSAILIDWGTTNARAYAIDVNGAVADRRASAKGVRNVPDRRFAEAFDTLIGDWRHSESVLVLMSGMVGSRQGWIEAPYLSCPVGAEALAGGLAAVPGRANAWIVPGICLNESEAHRDVIRGEEVQCFGALFRTGRVDAIVCLPGTHSKWVRMKGGRITSFATSMTGETFEVLRRHSILAALMPESVEPSGAGSGDRAWFIRGLDRSGDAGGLLHHMFSVRADGLFDLVPPEALADYLSGILVGHEIRAMAGRFFVDAPVLLVAGDRLAATYRSAFEHLAIQVQPVDAEEATVAGLLQVLGALPTV